MWKHQCLHLAEYFNSLIWIKENDPSELELAFQVQQLTSHLGILTPSQLLSFSSSYLKSGRNDPKVTITPRFQWIQALNFKISKILRSQWFKGGRGELWSDCLYWAATGGKGDEGDRWEQRWIHSGEPRMISCDFSSCVNLFSIWLSTAGDWVEVYKQGEEADGSGKYDHDYRDDYNDYIDYVDQHYSDCDDYDDNCIFYSSSPVSTSLSPWTLSRLVIDHFNIHCWIWLTFDWVVEWNS